MTAGHHVSRFFPAPNTSELNENSLGKTIITKQQILSSGYDDVRGVLEQVIGLDVYSDGPKGQKTSDFYERYKF